MQTTDLRILIADNHHIVRWGVKDLLASRREWLICAEASTGRQAVALAKQHKPDIIIMDTSLPELNGIEAARIIRKTLPNTEVLIFSMHCSEQLLREIVEAGVRAYVSQADAGRDLVLAVEALAKGRSFFTSCAEELMWHDPLTSREREVVQLIVDGKSNKEIAAMLGISVKTADTHRTNLMRKLNTHSVSEVIHYAFRNMRQPPLDPRLKYSWQQTVLDALIEYHADRIRDKVTAAERALSERLRQRPTDLEELVALREALIALQMVFPETKPKVESTEKNDKEETA